MQHVFNPPRQLHVLTAAHPCTHRPLKRTCAHPSRSRPDVQNHMHVLRSTCIFHTLMRHVHLCAQTLEAQAYTNPQTLRIPHPHSAHRGTHTCTNPLASHACSHMCSGHRILHVSSDLQTLTDVSESQVRVCVFRAGTYTTCADLLRCRHTHAHVGV